MSDDDTLVKWWPKLANVTAAEVTDQLFEWAAPVDRSARGHAAAVTAHGPGPAWPSAPVRPGAA